MAAITVLSPHLAELIAAGEVVERPASAVKEMVENAIDAGATKIAVEIEGGGTKRIRITDNGAGINEDDVEKAFLRHATSKIASEEDLEKIMTLGFRGEALASIAAVSKVTLHTKTKKDQFGTLYCIEGGAPIMCEQTGCPDGTEILVEELFFNTPARMKFLKKDVSEGNAVSAILDKLALSHPEVSFRLVRDGKEQLFTPGDKNPLSAIRSVLGAQFAKSLIPVTSSQDFGIKVEGFTVRPTASRPTKSMQHFFINGRYVKTNTCAAALEKAYHGSVMVSKYPACVLFLTIPPELVDVNVHPAKTEVRFQNEREVFLAVYYCVKNALFGEGAFPELKVKELAEEIQKYENLSFSLPVKPAAPTEKPLEYAAPTPKVMPVAPEETVTLATSARTLEVPSEFAYRAPSYLMQSVDNPDFDTPPAVKAEESEAIPDYRVIGEAYGTYIVVELADELLFIDKHASHERYLYEKLKNGQEELARQALLMPLQVTLSQEEYDAILSNADVLGTLGFAVEDFGPGTVLVREVPLLLAAAANLEHIVIEAAESLSKYGRLSQPKALEELYHSIACKAAVKGNTKSAERDLCNIVELVLRYRQVRYCPHGRPVAFAVTKHSLDKQFGRLG